MTDVEIGTDQVDEDETITREQMLELELAGYRSDVEDLREENERLRLLLKEYRARESVYEEGDSLTRRFQANKQDAEHRSKMIEALMADNGARKRELDHMKRLIVEAAVAALHFGPGQCLAWIRAYIAESPEMDDDYENQTGFRLGDDSDD